MWNREQIIEEWWFLAYSWLVLVSEIILWYLTIL